MLVVAALGVWLGVTYLVYNQRSYALKTWNHLR